MVSLVSSKVVVGFFLVFCSLLAGCLGGDDPESGPEGETNGERLPEDQVQVRGDVLDAASLDPVQGATVTLVQGGEEVTSTQTDASGVYELGGIDPGEYQLQVTSITHRSDARGVSVEEGEVAQVSFMLEAFPTARPYSEKLDWSGFMTLGKDSPVNAVSCCSMDPNADQSFEFLVGDTGLLRSIVVEAYWDNDNAGLQGYLWKDPDCDPGCSPSQQYGAGNGFGNLSFRADYDAGGWPGFDDDEDEVELSINVFPESGDEPATVMYQQEWTFHIEMFYVNPAPAGHVVRPDM